MELQPQHLARFIKRVLWQQGVWEMISELFSWKATTHARWNTNIYQTPTEMTTKSIEKSFHDEKSSFFLERISFQKFGLCLCNENPMSTWCVIIIKSVFNIILLPTSWCRLASNDALSAHRRGYTVTQIKWVSCESSTHWNSEGGCWRKINFYVNVNGGEWTWNIKIISRAHVTLHNS